MIVRSEAQSDYVSTRSYETMVVLCPTLTEDEMWVARPLRERWGTHYVMHILRHWVSLPRSLLHFCLAPVLMDMFHQSCSQE